MDTSTTPYGNISSLIRTQAATYTPEAAKYSREIGEQSPSTVNNANIGNGINPRKQEFNIEHMSGNEFRAMANELYERGKIDSDTHKNMIRSLLFSTDLGESGLGKGTYAIGTYISNQDKKINMIEHFETVLSERKEKIKKFNHTYDIKPYEEIVTTLKQLNEKYSSPKVSLIA